MAKINHAVLFYTKNWFAHTAEMDGETRGWFLSLVIHLCEMESLPDNFSDLAALATVRLDEYSRFINKFEDKIRRKFIINESGRLCLPDETELIKGKETNQVGRARAGNIGVITKMAKKFVDYSDFALLLKKDLSRLEDKNLDLLKDLTQLKKLIKRYRNTEPEKAKFDLSYVDLAFLPVFQDWLKYKKGRGERYKSDTSLKTCYNRMIKDSGNEPEIAILMIDYAISNNWAGFVKLHKNQMPGNNKANAGKAETLINQYDKLSKKFDDEQ